MLMAANLVKPEAYLYSLYIYITLHVPDIRPYVAKQFYIEFIRLK